MSFWGKLFSSTDGASDIINAAINTGDKLVYTDEEKADMKKKLTEFFPTLLKAYHPFKLAQRILATWFSFLFGIAFFLGVSMATFNIYTKFEALNRGVSLDKIVLLDTEQLINLVVSFNMHWIITAIISFYFTGGIISSFRKDN